MMTHLKKKSDNSTVKIVQKTNNCYNSHNTAHETKIEQATVRESRLSVLIKGYVGGYINETAI